MEVKVQALVREAIARGLLQSSHDVADGGLAIAAAESCIWGGLGLSTGQLGFSDRPDAALFGEAQSRFLVSCKPEDIGKLESLARERAVPLFRLGTVGGEHLRVANLVYVPVEDLAQAWSKPLSATD
jgi:phosphoribosylformylglycinamidine synthase